MFKISFLTLSFLILAQSTSLANNDSRPQFIYGYKYNNELETDKNDLLETAEYNLPMFSKALLPNQQSYKGGFNYLLPYIMPAPYQQGAGSCLFMSHTGAVEILLNLKYKKNIDLSERYFMNLKKASIGDELVKNWRVDTIYRLNSTGEIYSNKDYYFGKGYYKTVKGRRVFTDKDDPKANYGTKWNWVIDLNRLNADNNKDPISLPKFEREVLFEDPEENQWNIGAAPKDIVKRVINAFAKRKAPIEVIYNHHGFWHANIIVGYNEHANSHGCPFVSNYQTRMDARAAEITKEAEELSYGPEKKKLLSKARNFNKKGKKVQDEFIAHGGCREKGVFYVRDSIYPSKNQPLYDFDSTQTGEEAFLNEPVILRSYEWLERLSSNVVQIYIR
ncbi:MAG: hypothetical protein HN576_01730 [Bacteriovoracaceae bacterium]|jgi:hypothetical protein|nr:hypothetical protein [Bacteriovoracaceae bacterium]